MLLLTYTKLFDTPLKVRTSQPTVLEEKESSDLKLAPPVAKINPAKLASSAKNVNNFDIFWSMLNDVVGKDKLAKFSQYSLRLLLFWADRGEKYLSDPTLNFDIISKRYNDREKQLNLFYNFLKHPQNFVKIIIVMVLNIFQQRFAGMVKGLGLYRQFLRFGKSPFRLNSIVKKFTNTASKASNMEDFTEMFFSRSTMDDLIGFYYNFNDEGSLLYKLGMLNNKTIHKFVSKHEAYAWYCDTLFGLYKTYIDLQDIYQKELELKIQIQVKSRSRVISRQLLGSGESTSTNFNSSDERDLQRLKEIEFSKQNLYLDVYKLLSDFSFNSYTVFNAKLPFATFQIWMGMSASFLSIVKLYRQTKMKLEAR